ncbi:Cytochrome c oxidase assembly protein cox15 [Malassezia sp. CBS 17886]|nr:Cytochrome c oxidase assembly protein cox15 [Malassezia sp. CBS 17886]
MLRWNVLRAYVTTATQAPPPAPTTKPIVAYHLLITAALVFTIVVVGGITRLTESGLSITEWNPGPKGMRWPRSEEEWNVEWDKYKQSPEFTVLNQGMTLDDFKWIFMWEWSHRILGRFIGVFFVVPAAYFCVRRGMATADVRWKLGAIALGIGFQGFLGWYMVTSGLANPHENEREGDAWTPRVSHFRLAAHLGAAFAVYMGMLYTAVGILRDAKLARAPESVLALVQQLQYPKARRYRAVALGLLALVSTTAMYGAFVAGLDAGLVYSEFPMMGNGLLPPKDELLDPLYALNAHSPDVTNPPPFSCLLMGNVTRNPVTVQAIHRYLGLTTLATMLVFLRYSKRLKGVLPAATPRFATGAVHMTVTQALLGIATLIYMVPISLASLHQVGALVVLSMMTGVAATLRRPSSALQAWARARTTAHAAAAIKV